MSVNVIIKIQRKKNHLNICINDYFYSKPSYPRESEGLCFYRLWFVCLLVTTTTK